MSGSGPKDQGDGGVPWRRWLAEAGRRAKGHPRIVAAGSIAVFLGGVAILLYSIFGKPPGDFLNENVGFNEGEGQVSGQQSGRGFEWPTYGYNPSRTRYLESDLRPPFKRLWKYPGGDLIELSPTFARNTLFFINIKATTHAVDARTGERRWFKSLGDRAASAPTFYKGRLYITTLLPHRIWCLNAETSEVLWSRNLKARSESSPLAIKDTIYFGSGDGVVYALRADNGKRVWTYNAGSDVEGALAYSDGRLYFGDYNGGVTAIGRRTGKRIWKAGTGGKGFGRGGIFYSTPAVAYGRVYIGNNDGSVYSFAARNGKLAWRQHIANSEVYTGPAVGTVKKLGPTVYVGSYDRKLHALDARSGKEHWAFRARGRVNGAATIVGDVVYFADIDSTTTYGLDVATGNRVFIYGKGAFNPVISDGRRLYLTGYSSQYAFEPEK